VPSKSKKTVSLVLGSGGARGLAHIGVIRELEEADFEIRAISGSSIGALIGGVYAAGELDEFEKWMRPVTKFNLIQLMDFNWGKGGLVKGDKVLEQLTQLISDSNIEDLPIAYTAVATDIISEKEIWINSGSLFDAIRASISLPMFMTPVKRGEMVLVDGGVLNPVPIGPTFNDDSDLTIAVNLGGVPSAVPRANAEIERVDVSVDQGMSGKILTFIEKLADLSEPGSDSDKEGGIDMFNVADRSFDTMQNSIARLKLAAYPPDHLIEIPRNACGILDFHRTGEMIELGREKARLCIETIEAPEST